MSDDGVTPFTGILDQHQAVEEDEKKGEDTYEPSPEEQKAIRLVDKTFRKNKRERALYDQNWLWYYKMFRGKQWERKRPSYRHSEVINFVWRTIQSLVPIQTDFRPKPSFLPTDPTDLEFSEILNALFQADWESKNWDETLLELVYDGNITGTGISSTEPAENDRGEVEVDYRTVDPLYCYPDPEARDTDKDCETFVIAEPRDIEKVRRDYPDKARYLKPDVYDFVTGAKTDIKDVPVRSTVDNRTILEVEGPDADNQNKDRVLKLTAYFAPQFFDGMPDGIIEEEVPVIDEATGQPVVDPVTGEVQVEYERRRRWPSGRKIVVAGGVLLEDRELGLDDHEIPVERFANYVLPREFWGASEVEQIEGPQKIFNKIFSFALDVLELTGNPVWFVPTEGNVNPHKMVNRPGLVVPHSGGQAGRPTRDDGAQVNPAVFQLADRIGNYIDSMSGSDDITRGAQPVGVTAARAIESLQEASHTRIRLKSRNLDRYLRHFGRHWLSRVMQFYDQERVFRVTNEQGVPRYFRMSTEKNEQGGVTATVTELTENGKANIGAMRTFEIRGKFDVRVSTGSALPFAKAEKEDRLLQLFDRGIVDDREVLEQTDYPNAEAVLQRMEEKRRAEAEAQAMAQAGGVPPNAA